MRQGEREKSPNDRETIWGDGFWQEQEEEGKPTGKEQNRRIGAEREIRGAKGKMRQKASSSSQRDWR
jgi:hypothetical protein